MRKKLMILMMLLLVMAMAGCGAENINNDPGDQLKLGIIQIVEHPSLDAARQGFLDVLREHGYEEGHNLVVDYQNAQNDQANLQTIARKFVNDQVDLVLAVATPSAMTMANETTELPILFTAVTDPISAKLVQSLEKPGGNVTGTTDINPVGEQLALIKELVPKAKKIGIIYNASEINSQVQVDIADEAAPELGVELVKVTVSASSEVMQAAQSMIGKVDAIYLPTDNMIISSLSAIIKVAEEHQIPVITGETDSVVNGALASIGIDYYKLGRTTGEMALEIIGGKHPGELPVQSQVAGNLVINLPAAEKMGVKVPENLLNKAHNVIE